MKYAWQVKMIDGQKIPYPFCDHAAHALDNYHVNQVVTSGKFAGTLKDRSLKENNLYFKACSVFREMVMPNPIWEFANIDYWFRHYAKYYDHRKTMVMPNGQVHLQVLPLNFKGCLEAQANGYYNKAFFAQSGIIGVSQEVWVQEVKNRCGVR